MFLAKNLGNNEVCCQHGNACCVVAVEPAFQNAVSAPASRSCLLTIMLFLFVNDLFSLTNKMSCFGLPRLKKNLAWTGENSPQSQTVIFQIQKNHQKYDRLQTTAGSKGYCGIPKDKTSMLAFRRRLLMIIF